MNFNMYKLHINFVTYKFCLLQTLFRITFVTFNFVKYTHRHEQILLMSPLKNVVWAA